MDLSKLSDEDLAALEAGDLSKVSDEGLALLEEQPEDAAAEPAAQEAAAPVESGPSPVTRAAVEAGVRAGVAGAAAAAGTVGARTVGAAARPLTEKGRQKVALRAVERFAGGREELDAAMSRLESVLPQFTIAQPTIAQAGQNAGIAQLERNLRNHVDAMPIFTGADTRFADAIGGAIGSVAGTEDELQMALRDRDKAASRLYRAAYRKPVIRDNLSMQDQADLDELFRRPAIAAAQKGAVEDFLNKGEFPDENNAIQMMHGAKMNLDGQISAAVRAGDFNRAEALRKAKDDLVAQIEKLSRPYRRARKTYREMSIPIAQMEVGRELHNKLFPALADFGSIATMRPAMYAEALRNGDRTAQRATDFTGATMENTLDPDQLQKLNEVGRLLALRQNQQNLGRAVGSNTAQNLIGDDMLSSMLGPLANMDAVSQGGKALLKPISWLYTEPEQLVKQETARMLVDPAYLRAIYDRQRSTPTAKAGRAVRGAVKGAGAKAGAISAKLGTKIRRGGKMGALLALASALGISVDDEEGDGG